MTVALALWALATVDAAFVGYREAAGRSALIDKRDYYRRAMLRAALFGQAAVATAAAAGVILLALSDDPGALVRDLQHAGARMLTVYLPYALVILAAFAVRAAPSVDVRSITSVAIFGPFTLLRPAVAAAGVAWGFLSAPRPATLLLGALVLLLMLGLEHLIGALRSRGLIS